MGSLEQKTERNSFLFALFLMQYTLILPFTIFINPTLLTAGTSLTILFFFVLLNGTIRINLRFIVVLAGVFIALVLKLLMLPADPGILIVFSYTAFPAALAVVYDYDAKLVLKDLYKISLFSFLLVFWYPFIGNRSYMRFGYAVLPNVLFILCELLYNKKKKLEIMIAGAICLILLAEMFLFGSRGSFFSFLLFFAIEELLINKKNLKRKVILAIAAFAACLNTGPIINLIYSLLATFGIHSYSLKKYHMQLERGFDAASSGRNVMYSSAFSQLRESPIIGLPIDVTNSESTDVTYVHNLFLQTWMDLGIIGLIVLVLFLLYILWKIWKTDSNIKERILIASVFSIAIGRLMFSSVMWRRPEFWLLIFMSMKMGKQRDNYVKG